MQYLREYYTVHYYKRNIGDYHKKAGRLSILEHGAYTLLIDACYDRERFPTSKQEAAEWCWARTPEEIAAVEFVLNKFFQEHFGQFIQEHIKEELSAYRKNARTNKRIAIEREAARKVHGNRTNRARTVNESPPNQEPRTNNQEPLTNNQEPVITTSPRKRGKESAKLVTVADLMIDGIDHDLALEFLAHRAKLKASLTPRAWEAIKREAGSINWLPAQAVEKMLARGWRGFESAWITKELGQQTGTLQGRQLNKQELLEQHNAEVGRRWLEKQQQEDGTYDPAR